MKLTRFETIYLLIFILVIGSIFIIYGVYGYHIPTTNNIMGHQCLIQKATSFCESQGLLFYYINGNLISSKFICRKGKAPISDTEGFITKEFKFTKEELKGCENEEQENKKEN